MVGAARAGRRSGFSRVIAFDMGGTSTDVARWDGDFEYLFEHRVGDAHLVAPALAIESVAAGGGSICAFDGIQLKVGPESAGAWPGPACYGAGGPLTLTDVNLILGRLDPDRFEIPLDPAAAGRALDALPHTDGGEADPGPEAVLAGLLDIADERMAEAIRSISLRRGYDPAGHALVAFGGAGAQHACAVAELLGIASVLVPADAGLLSALGLGAAVVERFAQRQVLEPLDRVKGERIAGWLDELGREAACDPLPFYPVQRFEHLPLAEALDHGGPQPQGREQPRIREAPGRCRCRAAPPPRRRAGRRRRRRRPGRGGGVVAPAQRDRADRLDHALVGDLEQTGEQRLGTGIGPAIRDVERGEGRPAASGSSGMSKLSGSSRPSSRLTSVRVSGPPSP